MKLSLAVLVCLVAICSGKPDEEKQRQFEKVKSIASVKRMLLEKTNAIKPTVRTEKTITLSRKHGHKNGKKQLGAGQTKTIGISADQYIDNMEEMFTISAMSSSDKLRLTFTAFSLEDPASCGICWDYVEIFDGPDKFAPQLGRFCGSELPPSLVSSGRSISVLFQSDYVTTADGFSADVEIVDLAELAAQSSGNPQAGCSGGFAVLTGSSGVIETSNHPGNYGDQEMCRWQIMAQSGTIQLEIEDFEIEWCPASGCVWDVLRIYDGTDPATSPMLGTLCGWNMDWSNSFGSQRTWTTTGSSAYLVFTSDQSVGAKGFRIRYTVNADGVVVTESAVSQVTPAPAVPNIPPVPVNGVVLNNDFDAIRRLSLYAHNTLRANHQNTPPMTWSSSLEQGCQEWAITLANANAMYHSAGNEGENLYSSTGHSIDGSIARAAFAWYEERHVYNYASGASPSNGVIGHFTQLVWDTSVELGCAVASRGNKVWVVCRYLPPGNYIGQYTSHVHKTKQGAQFPQSFQDLNHMI